MMMSIQELRDLVWSHFLPYLCLFGILCNLFNVLIFVNKKLKSSSTYTYFLIHSFFDLVYFLLSFLYFFTKHTLMIPECSYLVNFIEFHLFLLLSTAVAIFLIFMEIVIALDRLFIITGVKGAKIKAHTNKIIMILFIISILTQYPTYKASSIVQTRGINSNSSERCSNVSYTLKDTEFLDSNIYKFSYTIATYFRGLIAPVMLLIINAAICVKFRRRINKKLRMRSISKCFRIILKTFFLKI